MGLIAFWRACKTNMQSTYDRIHYYKIDREQKKLVISKLKALLNREKQVELAWVFGSLTRRDSIRDVDVAIHSEPEMTFDALLDLNAQVELELGIPVDMVEIANMPQPLRRNILSNGILLKGKQKKQRQLEKTFV
jgi:predicted nucleotidyltransferase